MTKRNVKPNFARIWQKVIFNKICTHMAKSNIKQSFTRIWQFLYILETIAPIENPIRTANKFSVKTMYT